MNKKIIILLILILNSFHAKSELPTPDGLYQVSAYLQKCQLHGQTICILINKGLRSQRLLALAPTQWSPLVKSMLEIKSPISMQGTIEKGIFTPKSRPSLHLPEADDVVRDPNRAIKVNENLR